MIQKDRRRVVHDDPFSVLVHTDSPGDIAFDARLLKQRIQLGIGIVAKVLRICAARDSGPGS
jgi:hypothetical protein